jgi:hypothetical protein
LYSTIANFGGDDHWRLAALVGVFDNEAKAHLAALVGAEFRQSSAGRVTG